MAEHHHNHRTVAPPESAIDVTEYLVLVRALRLSTCGRSLWPLGHANWDDR